jgi:hypothetical protein
MGTLRHPHSAKDLPKPGDRIPPNMCLHCGLPGSHRDLGNCISALRDRIADLEFKVRGARRGPQGALQLKSRNEERAAS